MHIFLDIDGVLNCETDWRVPYTINPKCLQVFVGLIKTLEKTGKVYIILTSTWRAGISRTGQHSAQIQSFMDKLFANGITISGSTPVSDKGRQAEIDYYIRKNDVDKYIVLDDDESLFVNPKELNLYITNYKTGLVEKDIKQIIKRIR